jgi:hypothetical protein
MHADDVTLREFIEQRLADERRYYDQRFNDLAEALTKADLANERRLDGLNQWREQSHQREANFVGRAEFDQFKETWRVEHRSLASLVDQAQGRFQGAPLLIAASAAFLAIISVVIDILTR